MHPMVLLSVVGQMPSVAWLLALSSLSLVSSVTLLFHPVHGPYRVFAVVECFSEVVHFFVEKLWLTAYCSSPTGKSVNNLYFANKWWWLSHCRYWSMWVGFLYTVIDNVFSASGFTRVSKKGMAPSSPVSSTVNFMAGSTLLMWPRKNCFAFFLLDEKTLTIPWGDEHCY